MTILRDEHPNLRDCDGTIKFCSRVKSLITAMNCRTPANALKPGNAMWKSIESFLQFLEEWEAEAKDKKDNFEFITEQTCYGLKVSLKGALEICNYLVSECNFKYLMTARLNQFYF
ncbi:uncharacterized protein LOC116417382 [Nasonia vitripennis]|uniref:Uncharacterized protein n=1 Tax=Nasonia vitripennis TaxID=7425 RepID=A0A7M7TA14_NASVI|nr:uncharacterized protein LOC116417382 [Nasonia vitripennis]